MKTFLISVSINVYYLIKITSIYFCYL